MANLKEVRQRITSVQTTQQITKAMKLVAASKLKRATDRIVQMRPYSNKLYEMLKNILANVEVENLNLNFSEERKQVNHILIVLITSDKGLCGAFNANLIKQTKTLLTKYSDKNIELMTIGKKGYDAFKNEEGITINAEHKDLFQGLNFDTVQEVAQLVMNGFANNNYDKVYAVYAHFKNAATQEFLAEQFLPIAKLENEEGDNQKADYIFEPNKEELITELVPKILKTQFYRFLLDSNASEQGARMVAMEQATDNAESLLKDLKLVYNRERQAAITNEILEIVGGAAALEQG